MSISIYNKTLSPTQSLEIDVFVKSSPHYTIFQSPDFFSFYQSVPYYLPYYFIERSSTGEITGVMLAVVISEKGRFLSFFSSRCVVYGGPLAKNDDKEVISQLLSCLNNTLGNKTLFTQFRNFRDWDIEAKSNFAKNGFTYRERLNLLVPTRNEPEVLLNMSASRRRQIKKGIGAGVKIRLVQNMDEVLRLYEIISVLYHRKVRKPLPDKAFFTSFYNQVVKLNNGVMLLVIFENKIIGGVVCPLSAPFTLSELYVCGLDEEYPQCYPSVMATWAALSYAANNGIQNFDFMGLGKPEVPYGVRDFKLRFGGQVVNYGRFARRNHPVLYFIAEIGYNVLRKLKMI